MDMAMKSLSRVVSKKLKGPAAKKAAAPTARSAKSKASYILAAPKGSRTVSHRRIKEAVEKVFRERAQPNA
jgi:hypothetical protein